MCDNCFSAGDLVARFQKFHGASYQCDTCAVTRNEQCLPRAIVHGQKPARVFFGPRIGGVGTFRLFGISPTEAFSSAHVDGIPGVYGSYLARHTWMPELATALSTQSIKEIVYIGQTGGPAAKHLATPETADHPYLSDWHHEHEAVRTLAAQLYGEAGVREIEHAVPVHALREIETFIEEHAKGQGIKVSAGIFNPEEGTLRWVHDARFGTYGEAGNISLHKRFENRRGEISPVANDGPRRAYVGCMDSRAIPSHVLDIPATDAFVSTSMGGIWAPYASRLARLTWIPELAMALEASPIDELVFMGHTACAGAKLVSDTPTTDALRADWQATFKDALLPVAETLYGPRDQQAALQRTVEMAIPVYMKTQIDAFMDTHGGAHKPRVDAYLYEMRSGNLHKLCDMETGDYAQLTQNKPRDFDNLPDVCPATRKAFTCG